jgi:prophage antirepressor-like protein
MSELIKEFTNTEFGKLEVILIDSKPYFPATKCATILGYSKPNNAISMPSK